MENSAYSPLQSSDAPNPLRPYYRPPSISQNINAQADGFGNASSKTSFSQGISGAAKGSPSFGSSARDILSDLDYREILGDSAPSTAATIKNLLDQAVWKYSSVFMAQPFEVAKMVLQARLATTNQPSVASREGSRSRSSMDMRYPESPEEEEDDDEPSYFTSAAPKSSVNAVSPSVRKRRSLDRRTSASSKHSHTSALPASPYILELRRGNSLLEVISQLWAKEGAWGIWKGTNVTFLYTFLLKTIETWTRSMLSAVLNLPDAGMTSGSGAIGGLDIIDSPSPLASLGIAVAAAGIAGLFLAPLGHYQDSVCSPYVMLTTTSEQPRSLLPCFRLLPQWTCPSWLILPTMLHTTLPTFISTTTPLLLRSTLRIDPIITPTSYSAFTFLASTCELFIKLPVETVLRRGQMTYITEAARQVSSARPSMRSRQSASTLSPSSVTTVVEIGPYNGTFGTIWRIMRDEGETLEKSIVTTKGTPGTSAHRPNYKSKKGQGIQGLWRGWKVGWWGLVGVWSAAALGGGGGKGGEF